MTVKCLWLSSRDGKPMPDATVKGIPFPGWKGEKQMKRWSILSVLAAPILAILLALPAVAAPSQTASGTFTIVEQSLVETQLADGNIILVADETIAVSGDFVGTLAITTVYNFHSNGTFTSRSQGVFTGTVFGGPEGTVRYSSAGRGDWTPVGGMPTVISFQGQNVGQGSGGGLLGLHMQGSFDAPNYTGRVHFAP